MTAPTQRAGGLDANARGIAVLVVAVVIGFLLLLKAGDAGGSGSENLTAGGSPSTTVDTSGLGDDTTTSTTAAGSGATTTSTTEAGAETRAPGDVTVLVLNGSGKTGVAATGTETVGAAGYKTGTPGNANAQIDTTAVYYAEGYQAEATAVAAVLGKAPDIVQALPSPAPGPGADTANVVVVLGKETPAAGETGTDASTTTTTAAN